MTRLQRLLTLALASALGGVALGFWPAAVDAQPIRLDRPQVLFLMPAMEGDAQAQLREALLAQFAALEADLIFTPVAEPQGTLAQRMAQAQALSAKHALLVAFWIEAQPDGRWFVHMMDLQSERVIVRPVEAQPERRSAAIEAVAVMARESSRALIEGEPPPASDTVVAPPPQPAPASGAAPATPAPAVAAIPSTGHARTPGPAPADSAPAPAPGSRAQDTATHGPNLLRLWLSYTGSDFAPQASFSHGASLGVSWLGFAPIYAGLSYLWTPRIALTSPMVAFDVQRFPTTAYAGYRWDRGLLRIDAELGLTLEFLERSLATMPTPAGSGSTPPPRTIEPSGPSSRILFAVAPRLTAELKPLPYLGLFISGGVDALVTNFSYIEDKTQSGTLLRPNRFRPVAMAGIAVYP